MTRFVLCAALLGVSIPTSCYAAAADAVVVKNLNTGFDDATLAKLPNNASDPDFIVGSRSAAHVGQTLIARSTPLPPPFFGDAASTNSRWIAINSEIGEEGLNVIAGTYYVETQIELSTYHAATAQIVGLRYGAENKMENVSINGTPVWTLPISFGSDFFEWITIGDLGLGSFSAGVNTIRINVLNDGTAATVLALRLEGNVMATPVP